MHLSGWALAATNLMGRLTVTAATAGGSVRDAGCNVRIRPATARPPRPARPERVDARGECGRRPNNYNKSLGVAQPTRLGVGGAGGEVRSTGYRPLSRREAVRAATWPRGCRGYARGERHTGLVPAIQSALVADRVPQLPERSTSARNALNRCPRATSWPGVDRYDSWWSDLSGVSPGGHRRAGSACGSCRRR